KGWVGARAPRSLYRLTAPPAVALFFMLIAVHMAREIPANMIPVVRAFLLIGVVGAATTMVAMEYFLFGFDQSSALKKIFWFCVLLFPPLGPAFYCFIVYSRSNALEPQVAERFGDI